MNVGRDGAGVAAGPLDGSHCFEVKPIVKET